MCLYFSNIKSVYFSAQSYGLYISASISGIETWLLQTWLHLSPTIFWHIALIFHAVGTRLNFHGRQVDINAC